jgi:FixJ family two-component response regulator
MKTGAIDFLTKPVERETLFEALHRALARDASGRQARAEATVLRARFAALTPREREVFELVVAGRLNKQIAGQLKIAERTVKADRAQVLAKLGVGSAAELGALAERLRLLDDAAAPRA